MLPIRTVLHPTDFSENSAFALRLASSLARDYGGRLIVLHVAPPAIVGYGEGAVPPEPEGYMDMLREQLHALVSEKEAGVPVEYVLTEGETVPEILRVAEERGCDVIVMGTHGRTGLGRVLLGSVAEQVVRRAPCPVVTAKAPPGRPEASGESAPAAAGEGG
ncbi:MAG TPA: universal stress protein [Gemmataceae bacterium]